MLMVLNKSCPVRNMTLSICKLILMFVIFHSFILFFCLSFTDCDMVCDGIKEAAVHLAEFFPRSGHSTSESKERMMVATVNLSFRDLCLKIANLHFMLLTNIIYVQISFSFVIF